MSNANGPALPCWSEIVSVIGWPLALSWLVTLVRFVLEYIGISENYIFIVGLLWFSLGLAIYWSRKFAHKADAFKLIVLLLLVFSPLSRIPVAIAWWVDVEYNLGTHYGWYFDSFSQVLLNHMVYGTLVQLVPSMMVAAISLALLKRLRKSKDAEQP